MYQTNVTSLASQSSPSKIGLSLTQRNRSTGPLSCMLVLTIMCAIPMFAQTPEPAVRPTLAEAQALLKAHPELQLGIKSPALTTIAVTEAVRGGFALRFQSVDGYHGELTVLGPATVIMARSFFNDLIDKGMSLVKSGNGDAGGIRNDNNGCVNNNLNGNVQGNVTFTITILSCNK